MKKFTLLLIGCALTVGSLLQAQGYIRPALKNGIQQSAVKSADQASKNEEAMPVHRGTNGVRPVTFRSAVEQIVGTTFYDLQTNSSTQSRLINYGSGVLSASWTMSLNSIGGWSDRGSGYNHNDGSGWGAHPTARLESSRRTGWPALTGTSPDNEVVACHYSPEPYAVHLIAKDGSGGWVESDIPSNVPGGQLWPKAVMGGPDGNTMHAIAITTPTGNGGFEYLGIDGHLLYYRSLDGGANWDKIDVVLPGIDSSEYTFMSADDYVIDARGNTVAVMYMATWGDIKVAKSTDNGETWTTWTVYDFPLSEPYDLDGYTVDDIPPDTLTANGDAIRSNDGAGAIMIDHDGMVHAFYSEIWVSDDNFADRSWSFFPGINSINYWNETYGENNFAEIAGYLDEDGDGVFGVSDIINEVGSYGQGLASQPTCGIDADGNIYMAYSAVSETYFNENANPGLQHYRHIYVTVSTDGGTTWSDPYDIINEDLSDPLFYAFTEAVFPSMAREVDGAVHILYQQDFEPGIAVSGDEDNPEENLMAYSPIDLSLLGVTNTREVVQADFFNLTLAPNPASNQVSMFFDMPQSGEITVDIYNMMGQRIETVYAGQALEGNQALDFQVDHLPNGMYLIRMQSEDKIATTRLMVN